jgi:hypothetical protein
MDEKKSKFDYGACVKIVKNAPHKYHPSEIGFVCGMIDIDSPEAIVMYECEDSNWLYTVEFLNGKSMQIPEIYLQKESDSG